MIERIKHMMLKEFIQIFRDPRMYVMLFVVPMIQLMLFGYAVSTDVKHVPTAVYDLDQSVQSRELIARFVKSGYFDIVAHVTSDREAQDLLDRSRATVILHLIKGFGAAIGAGRTACLQVLVDGTDSNTGSIVMHYSAKIAGEFSQQILLARFQRLSGAAPPPAQVTLASRAWFNENLESRNFYVPGVVATLVMLITLILTSMAIVREKEIGTMEQIMVTPMTRAEFILGKTVPFALIAFMDVVLIILLCVFWFDVPIRGRLIVLFLATSLYLISTLSIGLFISTVSQTQQQAMTGTFFFFMPAMLLSGFMFPIANMPTVVQWLTYFNPLRYFLVIVRGIFLKGIGIEILWPQMLALLLLGLLTLGLSIRRFHKTLV